MDIKLKFQFDMQTMIIPLMLAVLSNFNCMIRKNMYFILPTLKCEVNDMKIEHDSDSSSSQRACVWGKMKIYSVNLRLLVAISPLSRSLSPRQRKFMLFNIKST